MDIQIDIYQPLSKNNPNSPLILLYQLVDFTTESSNNKGSTLMKLKLSSIQKVLERSESNKLYELFRLTGSTCGATVR